MRNESIDRIQTPRLVGYGWYRGFDDPLKGPMFLPRIRSNVRVACFFWPWCTDFDPMTNRRDFLTREFFLRRHLKFAGMYHSLEE